MDLAILSVRFAMMPSQLCSELRRALGVSSDLAFAAWRACARPAAAAAAAVFLLPVLPQTTSRLLTRNVGVTHCHWLY
jgi:hypothetical protein